MSNYIKHSNEGVEFLKKEILKSYAVIDYLMQQLPDEKIKKASESFFREYPLYGECRHTEIVNG